MRTNWHFYMRKSNWKNQPQFSREWDLVMKLVQILFYFKILFENRTCFLIELRFSSRSLCIIYWFLLFFFSHGTGAIGSSWSSSHLRMLLFSCCYYFFSFYCYLLFFLLLLLFFFSCCYYSSHMVLLFSRVEVI